MLRQGSTPLRFAHSTGALAVDQATRDAMRDAFAPLKRPPVILQVTPTLATGEVEMAGLWAAEATVIAGGRAMVAAANGPAERLKRIGAEFHALPLDGRGPVAVGRNAGRLRRLIEEHDVDIVHARSREIAWAARQATRGGKALLVTSCGVDAPFRDAARDGGALIEGECIVAGSSHVRDIIAAADAEKGERTAVIPDGVDLAAFSPTAISGERLGRLARAWGMLEEPAPMILAPGPIEPLRGQHVLARALELLGAEGRLKRMVTIIAGEADRRSGYAEQLSAIARKSGMAGRMFLAAGIEDVPAALMLADVVVSLPIEPLGQDQVAVMAMALGKPIVGAAHGATAEIILDGETGRLVRPDDPAAVAAALHEMLWLSTAERAGLAEVARARAKTYFSAIAAGLATVRLYGALLASTQR